MLFYVYKAPPTYDETLNQEVIGMFGKVPFFLLGFGFWQLTSMHLLPYKDYPLREHEEYNKFNVEEHVLSLYDSVSNIRKYSGPAQPMFWFFFSYLIALTFKKKFYQLLHWLFP